MQVVYMSLQNAAAVQRSLKVTPDGKVELFVHCRPINVDQFVSENMDPPMPLDKDSVNSYVDRIVTIVNNVRGASVCSGYDEEKFQHVWSVCPFGEVDKNPYQECRYIETIRSPSCKGLVNARKWRCTECQKLYAPLRRRAAAAASEERHVNTANKYLTEEQRLKKLQEQRAEIEKLRKKNYRLQQRMREVIEKKGVQIDSGISDDLFSIASDNPNVSPAQSVFMQQQIKASQKKNMCGMRWHPTMIRFALSLHQTSAAAYHLIQNTGMIKLPSSRTLFEYSHAYPVEEGLNKTVLKSVAERTKAFTEKHKKKYVLMADEMHISQNLIFQNSTGRMIGYTALDTVEREVRQLEHLIDDCEKEFEETLASKALVFMVKGVSNGIKEVVATYFVGNLSANQLYMWTWEVIGALERCGMEVVAFVSDGSAVNRAFIKKHTPATPHPSGIVFDTWNKAAPARKLYFIADVPHLLKTIRNCFLNSRWDGRKSRRKMMKNGKRISWDYIIKLYEEKKGKNLRKSFKLNAQMVYPDSYARMKVGLAAKVLSKTVATDMQSQGWFNAVETINFIERVNNCFDCLNGAFSNQDKTTRNKRLAGYKSLNDERFEELEGFLNYLEEWGNDAQTTNVTINASTATVLDSTANVDGSLGGDESAIEEVCEDDTPASRRQLSQQTLEGIKMTTLAFKPLVQYLLQEGATFINARIFTQDPLEQYFSKLRGGFGGSTTPNAGQVLNKNNAFFTIGQMGMKKRKGNSGEGGDAVEVTDEKLPKRHCNPCNRLPHFLRQYFGLLIVTWCCH